MEPAENRSDTRSKFIAASPAQVFAAMQDPGRVARWWGPTGFTNTIHKYEFTPGGSWLLTMHGPDGKDYPNESRFTRIVQDQLFVVGADLATPGEATSIPRVGPEEVAFLERAIDALEAELAPLKQFIQPGGTLAAAYLHLARTICRRAERAVVTLAREEPIGQHVVVYLNRLSDCLFVLARAANARAGVADVPWNSPRQKPASD